MRFLFLREMRPARRPAVKMSVRLRRASLFSLCGALLFLCCILCGCQSSLFSKDRFLLSVMVLEEDGVTVEGKNPVKVSYGDDASFSVLLPEGKSIVELLCDGEPLKENEYSYLDGVLTLKNVTSPHTLRIAAGTPGDTAVFWVESNSYRGGGVITTLNQGRVPRGAIVTFTASPNDGAKFLGWSRGGTLDKGGTLQERSEQYTTVIDRDVTIYANYDDSGVAPPKKQETPQISVPTRPQLPQFLRKELIDVVYDANGGTTADGSDTLRTDFCIDYYTMPNALPEDGTFVRDGYVLTGYNTKKDGSGKSYAPGYKVTRENPDKAVTLFCMWEKAEPASSFIYEETEQGIVITGYTGNADRLCIPKQLDGKPVVRIDGSAFAGGSFSYVYLPSTVYSVADGAFANCPNLSEIAFSDALLRVSDDTFSGSPLRTLTLYAADLPRYADSDLSFHKKYERFAEDPDADHLIFIAGSSKHFGFDSDYAEELCDGKYVAVNYGTNAQMNVLFFLEALANLANDGDILIYAPEQYGPFCDTVNGNPQMNALTFQGCESCYNLVPAVDLSQYTDFFRAYSEYAVQRNSLPKKSYEVHATNIDVYGDCSIPRRNYNSDRFHSGANGTFHFAAGTIPASFVENVNRALSPAIDRGIPVYISYPPYNINACAEDELNDAAYDAYNADIENVLSGTLISDVRDYIYEAKYFFNTDYHLMEEGARLHTEQTMKDLLKAGI